MTLFTRVCQTMIAQGRRLRLQSPSGFLGLHLVTRC